MTTGMNNPQSMRYALDEVLSGMLATVSRETFADDHEALARMFEDLASRFPLFAPMANGVNPDAVRDALAKMESRNILRHEDGQYSFTVEGRAQCVSSKRTLFKDSDREQLEEAARAFDELGNE